MTQKTHTGHHDKTKPNRNNKNKRQNKAKQTKPPHKNIKTRNKKTTYFTSALWMRRARSRAGAFAPAADCCCSASMAA